MSNSFTLDLKHIPFLEIDNPPSPFALREAKEAALKKYKRIARNDTFVRWDINKVERARLLDNYSSFKTVYVRISDLQEKIKQKEECSLIGITYPAVADLGVNKEKIKRFGGPQFAFGGYYYTDKLFFLDDIFQWSHNRILWSEIRTAKHIIDKARIKS